MLAAEFFSREVRCVLAPVHGLEPGALYVARLELRGTGDDLVFLYVDIA
jgi:hypothetical protein